MALIIDTPSALFRPYYRQKPQIVGMRLSTCWDALPKQVCTWTKAIILRKYFSYFLLSLPTWAFPSVLVPRIELTDSVAGINRFILNYSLLDQVRGFRQLLNYADDWPGHNFCSSPSILRDAADRGVLDILERFDFHFELQIWPEQATECVEALRKVHRCCSTCWPSLKAWN